MSRLRFARARHAVVAVAAVVWLVETAVAAAAVTLTVVLVSLPPGRLGGL